MLKWNQEEISTEPRHELTTWKCVRGVERMCVSAGPGIVTVEGVLILNDAEAEDLHRVLGLAIQRCKAYRQFEVHRGSRMGMAR